jgi:hypothetical protein
MLGHLDDELLALLERVKELHPKTTLIKEPLPTRYKALNRTPLYCDRYTLQYSNKMYITLDRQALISHLNSLLNDMKPIIDITFLHSKLQEVREYFPQAVLSPNEGSNTVSLHLDGKTQTWTNKILEVNIFMHGVVETCKALNIEPHVEQVTNSKDLNKLFAKAKKLMSTLSLADNNYVDSDYPSEHRYQLLNDGLPLLLANETDMFLYLEALITGYNLAPQS